MIQSRKADDLDCGFNVVFVHDLQIDVVLVCRHAYSTTVLYVPKVKSHSHLMETTTWTAPHVLTRRSVRFGSYTNEQKCLPSLYLMQNQKEEKENSKESGKVELALSVYIPWMH